MTLITVLLDVITIKTICQTEYSSSEAHLQSGRFFLSRLVIKRACQGILERCRLAVKLAVLIKTGVAAAAALWDVLNKGALLKLTDTLKPTIIHPAITEATAPINLSLIDRY